MLIKISDNNQTVYFNWLLITFFLLSNLMVFYASAGEYSVSTSFEFQKALNMASNNGGDDVILLKEGIYFGGFKIIIKENYELNIKAEEGCNRKNVILDGANKETVLKITSDNTYPIINIEEITIRNGGENGLHIASSGTIHIESCQILNSYLKGIEIYNQYGSVSIIKCIINKNRKNGIYIENGDNILIKENGLKNQEDCPILLKSIKTAKIDSNLLSNNYSGIQCHNIEKVAISFNNLKFE